MGNLGQSSWPSVEAVPAGREEVEEVSVCLSDSDITDTTGIV